MMRYGPLLRGPEFYAGNPWALFETPKGDLDPSRTPGLLTNPYRDDGTAHLPGDNNDTGLYTRDNYWFNGSEVVKGRQGRAYYRNASEVNVLVAGGLIPGNEQPGTSMTIVSPNGQEVQAIRPPAANSGFNNGGQPEIYNSVGNIAPIDAVGWRYSDARPNDDPEMIDYGTSQYAYKTDVIEIDSGITIAALSTNEGYDPALSQQPGYGIALYVRRKGTTDERLIGLVYLDYQGGRTATARMWGVPQSNPGKTEPGVTMQAGDTQFLSDFGVSDRNDIEFIYEYQTPAAILSQLDAKVGQPGYVTNTIHSVPGVQADNALFVDDVIQVTPTTGGTASAPRSATPNNSNSNPSTPPPTTTPTASGGTTATPGTPPATVAPPAATQTSGNPLPFSQFSADPSALVVGDTLWIMPSHDPNNASYWTMTDYIPYSTTDLVNWQEGPVAFSISDVSWANEVFANKPANSTSQGVYLYAPDIVARNGKYYLYFPVTEEAIGVAVSDSPDGPYVDAIGRPLVDRSNSLGTQRVFDPGVFIDDDGQAYMVFGGGDQGTDARIVKLGDDMVSLDGPVQRVEGLPRFFEAAYLHQRGDTYYLSYSAKYDGYTTIDYATAKDPMGPWTYQGTILDSVPGWTNHHSIVDYKGKSYLFYHVAANGNQYTRRVAVEEFQYNPDGTIPRILQTSQGVQRVS